MLLPLQFHAHCWPHRLFVRGIEIQLSDPFPTLFLLRSLRFRLARKGDGGARRRRSMPGRCECSPGSAASEGRANSRAGPCGPERERSQGLIRERTGVAFSLRSQTDRKEPHLVLAARADWMRKGALPRDGGELCRWGGLSFVDDSSPRSRVLPAHRQFADCP